PELALLALRQWVPRSKDHRQMVGKRLAISLLTEVGQRRHERKVQHQPQWTIPPCATNPSTSCLRYQTPLRLVSLGEMAVLESRKLPQSRKRTAPGDRDE